jgi:hypothetical protein
MVCTVTDESAAQGETVRVSHRTVLVLFIGKEMNPLRDANRTDRFQVDGFLACLGCFDGVLGRDRRWDPGWHSY